jgi:hypothetical protein
MNSAKCERCGRPAKVRETVVEDGKATTRHYCARHGRSTWYEACHDSLVASVDALPEALLPRNVDRATLQARLSEARTLSAARSVFQSLDRSDEQ